MSEVRRIALCTGGGDAPGLNAVLRAAVVSALNRGWECLGIRDGFNGILNPEDYGGQGVIPMGREAVRGITHLGGTILGTTNKGNPLKFPVQDPDGNWTEVDRGDEVVRGLHELGVDALISVGGDGSLAIAHALAQRGLRVVGVPKTIDNDLEGTVATFGFDTAVEFATECLDRLHSTAAAHRRVMVVEVMGRYAGWISLHAGVAGTADVILIPEIPYDIQKVADKVRDRHEREQKAFSIVVVAEGAHPAGGTVSVIGNEPGRLERLGGAGEKVAAELQTMTGLETRCVVLGHLLRGGSPSSMDRLLSLRFGAAAVRALAEGMTDVMVALDPPLVRYVPLERCVSRMKRVPLHGDTVATARDLGVCFGD
jgi:phosphofructokinase-like protein